jgi:hypothetical protein
MECQVFFMFFDICPAEVANFGLRVSGCELRGAGRGHGAKRRGYGGLSGTLGMWNIWRLIFRYGVFDLGFKISDCGLKGPISIWDF